MPGDVNWSRPGQLSLGAKKFWRESGKDRKKIAQGRRSSYGAKKNSTKVRQGENHHDSTLISPLLRKRFSAVPLPTLIMTNVRKIKYLSTLVQLIYQTYFL